MISDPATGKPKGFGFCEYYDIPTATRAVDTLSQNAEINGRRLRVHFGDRGNRPPAGATPNCHGGPPPPQDRRPAPGGYPGVPPPMHQQPPPARMAHPGKQIPPAGYGAPPIGHAPVAPAVPSEEAVTNALAQLTPQELHRLLVEMKEAVDMNPEGVRQVLFQQPELAYALCQALLMTNHANPDILAVRVGAPHSDLRRLGLTSHPEDSAAHFTWKSSSAFCASGRLQRIGQCPSRVWPGHFRSSGKCSSHFGIAINVFNSSSGHSKFN